jgi:hypothetical protein
MYKKGDKVVLLDNTTDYDRVLGRATYRDYMTIGKAYEILEASPVSFYVRNDRGTAFYHSYSSAFALEGEMTSRYPIF